MEEDLKGVEGREGGAAEIERGIVEEDWVLSGEEAGAGTGAGTTDGPEITICPVRMQEWPETMETGMPTVVEEEKGDRVGEEEDEKITSRYHWASVDFQALHFVGMPYSISRTSPPHILERLLTLVSDGVLVICFMEHPFVPYSLHLNCCNSVTND